MECPFCHKQVDVHAIPAFDEAICPSCNATITVPGRLAQFLLLSRLGSGGMGSVYRAYDQTLARIVAVKVMLKSLGDQPEFVASFQREAQAAAKLNHPNIAQIYSFGQEKGQPYIVMELVPGKHFDEMIAEPEFLDQALVMKIGMDIADGLQLAAASNLIHGDIKPENILLDDRGVAKLVDFGIASAPNQGNGEIWGTPYYIAPEKLRRQRVDYRSDIYCLGGTLYHALTKHPPFDGEDAMAVVKARLNGPPAPMKKYRPDIDPEVTEIIDRMLQLEPAMRYPTYGSLLSDMRRYLSNKRPQAVTSAIGGSKRIVIKGRGRGKTSQPLSSSGTGKIPNSTGRHPLVVSRGMVDPQQSQQMTAQLAGLNIPNDSKKEEDQPKGNSKTAVGCVIAAGVIALILILGGLGIFLHLKKQTAKRAENWTALQKNGQAQMAAIMSSGNALQNLHGSVIHSYVEQADNIISQAITSVEAEMDIDPAMREKIMKEESPEPQAIVPDVLDAEAPAEAEAAKSSENSKEKPAADDKAASDDQTAKAKAKAGESAPEGEDAVSPAEDSVVEEAPLDGIPLLAREVFLALQPVRDTERMAIASLEKVQQIAMESSSSIAGYQSYIPDFSNKASYESDAANFGGVLTSIYQNQTIAQAEVSQVTAASDLLPKAISKARTKLGTLLGETSKLAEIREKAEAEEAARIQAEKEAAAKAAAEEAARQLEQSELAQLDAAVAGIMSKVKDHRYRDAVLDLKNIEDFKSEGAQKRLELYRKRAQALKDLHVFLIEQISKAPVEIVFKMNGSTFYWKILEANNLQLYVSNSRADPVHVSWSKIGPEQVVPLIRHYLEDPAQTRKYKLIERTRQQMNAAVYYVVFGSGSEAALKAARSMVDEVVQGRSKMKKEVQELLPELFEEGGDSSSDEDSWNSLE